MIYMEREFGRTEDEIILYFANRYIHDSDITGSGLATFLAAIHLSTMNGRFPRILPMRSETEYINRLRFLRHRERMEIETESIQEGEEDLGAGIEEEREPIGVRRKRNRESYVKNAYSMITDKDELKDFSEYCKHQYEKRVKRIDEIRQLTAYCSICQDSVQDGCVVALCGHTFCPQHYIAHCSQALTSYTQRCHQCPICRTEWNDPNRVHFLKGTPSELHCEKVFLDAE